MYAFLNYYTMPRTKKKYNERIEIGRDANGNRIRKWIRADTKPELEALRRQAYRELQEDITAGSLFGAYADKWFQTYKANRAISTQQMYTSAINKMSGISEMQVSDITATDLQQIIQKNWDHPRICEILQLTLKQIFKCAIRDRMIDVNADPAEHLEIPKRQTKETRFITDDEMDKILQISFKPEDRRYIDVLRNTGMRPSEALALCWEDIDWKEKQIYVHQAFEYKDHNIPILKPTKTGRDRFIPLNSSLASVLLLVRQDKGYVFLRDDGTPYTKSAYKKMYHRIFSLIADKLGETDLVMYSFRHTFATFLYYHGCRPGLISTKKAAQIMGHSEKIFLDRYTHIDDSKENVAAILEKI